MTQEEKNTLIQAAAILENIGIATGHTLSLSINKLIAAVEKTGKPTRFTVGNKDQPLQHLVKEEQKQQGKRVTLKDTMPNNVLATSEKKTTRKK